VGITIPNAQSFTMNGQIFSCFIPKLYVPGALVIIDRIHGKHNGYGKLSLDVPFKPRTTGPESQSHHLHGHLSQLAIYFGYDLAEMKLIMKDSVPEWPVEERKFGKTRKLRPVSEATVSTVVEAKAIDWCHRVAAEEGIELKESADDLR